MTNTAWETPLENSTAHPLKIGEDETWFVEYVTDPSCFKAWLCSVSTAMVRGWKEIDAVADTERIADYLKHGVYWRDYREPGAYWIPDTESQYYVDARHGSLVKTIGEVYRFSEGQTYMCVVYERDGHSKIPRFTAYTDSIWASCLEDDEDFVPLSHEEGRKTLKRIMDDILNTGEWKSWI